LASSPPLPSVSLVDRTVEPAVLKRVSYETMKRFQVVAFEETDKELKLAIVYPEQLKQGFFTALKDMESKVGRTIKLFKTDPQSFSNVLKQYPSVAAAPKVSSPVPPKAPAQPKNTASTPPPPPPLFKLGQQVALNYLKRIPLDYAEAHRLVSVDFFPPKTYWFLTDGKNGDHTKKLVAEIEKTNEITVHLIKVEEKDLDDLLAYYADKLIQEKKEQEAAKKKEFENLEKSKPTERAPVAEEESEKVANDVTVPDVQASIISTEEEKHGLAGLFQRVTHSFGGSKGEEKEGEKGEEKEDDVPPAPAPPAPAGTQVIPVVKDEKVGMKPAEMVQPTEPVHDPKVAPAPGTQPSQSDEEGEIGKLLEKQVDTVEELKEHIKKGFIPRIVAAVVSFAIHEKASDIHIESFDDEVRVRYRVDGQLLDIVKLPPDVHAAMVSRIKILSRLRLDETRIPQDGRFDVTFDHAQVDLRVSVMPTVHGEKVAMRILDKARGVTSLEKLGIEGLGYQNLMESIQKPFGVCLSTGPTGSGKSTTLYAILNRIATPNVNVVTLEDPVEYEMKGINQSQIRPKIGFTFAEGLRSVLRQDPNIIMVGEIRDGETANMATQAALTGHLVLSTLHTNDAAGAIPRLTNMGIEPFLITSSLNVAIGQRLVRKICPFCKKEVSLPPGFKMQIEQDITRLSQINQIDSARLPKEIKFYQGMGCPKCGGKGYQGRVGIYEVLTMTDALSELTLKHAPNAEIQAQAQKQGMLTMYEDGLIKVVNGITTLDEVLRETSNK
jgi:type II secretory ATPase GspE/PulE/Tfp pilus assembly ATPase PilB-like protein